MVPPSTGGSEVPRDDADDLGIAERDQPDSQVPR